MSAKCGDGDAGSVFSPTETDIDEQIGVDDLEIRLQKRRRDTIFEWWNERLQTERTSVERFLTQRHDYLLTQWSAECNKSFEDGARMRKPCMAEQLRSEESPVAFPSMFPPILEGEEMQVKPLTVETSLPSRKSPSIVSQQRSARTRASTRDAAFASQYCDVYVDKEETTYTETDKKTWFVNDALHGHRERDSAANYPSSLAEHRLRPGLSTQFFHQKPKSMWRVLTDSEKYGGKICSWEGLAWLVQSNRFELVFSLLIVLNCVVMALETQYQGLNIGHQEEFPGCNESAEKSWHGAEFTFKVLQYFFGTAFTLELLMKLAGLRQRFFSSGWNMFDSLIVISWIASRIGFSSSVMNPMMLRILRLARLLRMLRLTRMFAVFDVMHLLVGSIKASGMVLLWSLVFLLVMMTMMSLILSNSLGLYLQKQSNDFDERYEVYQYFGTFSRSMLTMWEITLGNWVPVCRALMENISEWFSVLFLLWQSIVGFAIVTVIRGVFLHETFKVADRDDELMIMQKSRIIEKNRKAMKAFFKLADISGDGVLSFDEFKVISQDERMRTWMAAMDLEVWDANIIFSMMDNGDGKISVDELLDGFQRLRGQAKSADLVHLMHMTREVQYSVAKVWRLVRTTACR